MHSIVYRWRLHPGSEDAFRAAWEDVTRAISAQCGSYGSRLHSCADGTWVAYAAWPDEQTHAACQPDAPAAVAAMSAAIAERFEPLHLEVVSDLLSAVR